MGSVVPSSSVPKLTGSRAGGYLLGLALAALSLFLAVRGFAAGRDAVGVCWVVAGVLTLRAVRLGTSLGNR